MASSPKLTVLLLAKDESARLPAFFKSLRGLGLPYRVLVLEHGSSDGTPALARRLGADVRRQPWEGYAQTKNRGIQACRTEWVLSLDADENPDSDLCASVRRAVESPWAEAYELCRLNHFLGRPMRHGGWHPDWQLRLFRKGSARFNRRLVHEGMELTGPSAKAGRLSGQLLHFSYPSLNSYFERLNRYTGLQAAELFDVRGAKPEAALARMLADPPLTFLKMALLKEGFLDGAEGLVLAALSASSTFWKYAKWWHLSWKALGGKAGRPWVET